MCVLHRCTNRHEQVQAVFSAQLVLIAVLGDGNAPDQLHHEIRSAGLGGAGVEDAGDVFVLHHRQRLPLGLEARDDLLGVHPQLDDLQRDAAADGMNLLGHEDDAEAALADLFQELVASDRDAGGFDR